MTKGGLLVIALLITHFLKIPFNWKIHNLLHPKDKVKFKTTNISRWINETNNERRQTIDSNFLFVYLSFVFIWFKHPPSKRGKFLVWLVHIIGLLEILIIAFIVIQAKS